MPRPRTKSTPLYWKDGRAYADFRGPDYAPWGGGRKVALVPAGERFATTDAEVAQVLLGQRLEQFRQLREQYPKGLPAQSEDPLSRLAPFAGYHLQKLRKGRRGGRVASPREIDQQRTILIHAVRFLVGLGRNYLVDVTAGDVSLWLDSLEKAPPTPLKKRSGGRSGPLSGSTLGKYLAALRRLFRRAWKEQRIPTNPVELLADEDRPRPGPSPTHHLEIPEAALALAAARRYRPAGGAHPENLVKLATYLLTGGSGNDVEGLELADLDFENRRIRYRPNSTRAHMKTRFRTRIVPMFPQLHEYLVEFLNGPHAPEGPALFTGGDFRRWLDGVAASLGWPPKYLRRRVFRVTYATARAQTLDNGAPVSIWTVRDEMGHGSLAMLQNVYARVGQVRQRREWVEYRIEEFPDQQARLEGCGALPSRWHTALAALPRAGAPIKAWQQGSGLPVGTLYYARDRLLERGLVVKEGQGRGSIWRRTPLGNAALDRDEGTE